MGIEKVEDIATRLSKFSFICFIFFFNEIVIFHDFYIHKYVDIILLPLFSLIYQKNVIIIIIFNQKLDKSLENYKFFDLVL